MLAVALVALLMAKAMVWGRWIYAVGGNPEAAIEMGIPVKGVLVSTYVISGFCVGVGAVILAGRTGASSPLYGNLLELDTIAAVIIGGASFLGGRGHIGHALIGAVMIGVIRNALNLLETSFSTACRSDGAPGGSGSKTGGAAAGFMALRCGAGAQGGVDVKIVGKGATDCTEEKGINVAQDILTANPGLKAIYAACGPPAAGAAQAIKNAKLDRHVILVGFDFCCGEAEPMAAGIEDASVAQFPAKMSELGVDALVKAVHGETVPSLIDFGRRLGHQGQHGQVQIRRPRAGPHAGPRPSTPTAYQRDRQWKPLLVGRLELTNLPAQKIRAGPSAPTITSSKSSAAALSTTIATSSQWFDLLQREGGRRTHGGPALDVFTEISPSAPSLHLVAGAAEMLQSLVA